uniref:Uncharacterized protein n=1 Tax=Sphaerodactylus townsendi TaxID=933632 RepID=A0ACB8ETY0_9SAUR
MRCLGGWCSFLLWRFLNRGWVAICVPAWQGLDWRALVVSSNSMIQYLFYSLPPILSIRYSLGVLGETCRGVCTYYFPCLCAHTILVGGCCCSFIFHMCFSHCLSSLFMSTLIVLVNILEIQELNIKATTGGSKTCGETGKEDAMWACRQGNKMDRKAL